MAAYNWIEITETTPCCGKHSLIKAQCHVASSYSGDERGRFFDRVYRLGEDMNWWPEGDARWTAWSDVAVRAQAATGTVEECCYARCGSCGAALYALLAFESARPIAVVDVGLEDNWPPGFAK